MSEKLDFAENLWDQFKEVKKRFDNALDGASVTMGCYDKFASQAKSNAKFHQKLKLKTDDYGSMGEVMKKIMEYFTKMQTENANLQGEIKQIKDELGNSSKKLKKDLSKQCKEESKETSALQKAMKKVASAKKKDKSDAKKWISSKKTLEELANNTETPAKKIASAQGSEKKARAQSIKSREAYEIAVSELKEQDNTYHGNIGAILRTMEQLDIQRLHDAKDGLVKFADSLLSFYDKVKGETQQLKAQIEMIDPEEFVNEFVNTTKTSNEREDPEGFDPEIKDKADYDKETFIPERKTDKEDGGSVSVPAISSSSSKKSGGIGGKTYVIATCDFDPSSQKDGQEDENVNYLTLKENDRIELIDKNENGWWLGELNGEKGFFPMNYVRNEGEEEPAEDSGKEEEEEEEEEEYEVIETIKATADYKATTESELSMNDGDSIDVFQKNEDGWWFGKIGGKKGYFPYNYTTAYEGDDEED